MTDKTDLPKVIYLIPDGDGYVWCEDPAPGVGMEEKDAVKYLSTAAFIEQACEAVDETEPLLQVVSRSGVKAKIYEKLTDRFNPSED